MIGTRHELKTLPPYFGDVVEGRKTFEVRHTFDRTFAVGDVLHLREWDYNPDYEVTLDFEGAFVVEGDIKGFYSGRAVDVAVVYLMLGGSMGIPANLAVMGIVLVDGKAEDD